MELIDGRKIADEILSQLKGDVDTLRGQSINPKLCVILVGEDPASLSYIKQKRKSCEVVGIEWEQINYSEDEIDTEGLITKINELNEDEKVHGILVQLPLPKGLYVPEILKAIKPKKDVDGFTAYNLGKMFLSKEFEDLAPCTPLGVIKMLEYHNVEIQGKEVVVVGHSNLVGKPLSTMLLNRNATVTTCHVFTKDLAAHTKRADILCVAVGKAGLITEDMVKDGVVIIDIGVSRMENGKLTGDVDFKNVSKKASLITPVPGGVGPMTVACLMENTVKAAKLLNNKN